MLALLVACACWIGPQGRVTFPDPPAGTVVVDEAGLLTAADRRRIDAVAGTTQAAARIPIRVVTVRSLASRGAGRLSPARYARLLFDHWALGTRARNRGLLILICHRDRKLWIEPGAGWGSRKTAEFQAVVDRLMVPHFKRGEFGEGIVLGVSGLDALARDVPLPGGVRRAARDRGLWVLLAIMAGVALLLVAVALRHSRGPVGQVVRALLWPLTWFGVALGGRDPLRTRRRHRLIDYGRTTPRTPKERKRLKRMLARLRRHQRREPADWWNTGIHGYVGSGGSSWGGFTSGGFSGGGGGGGGFGGGGGAGGSW